MLHLGAKVEFGMVTALLCGKCGFKEGSSRKLTKTAVFADFLELATFFTCYSNKEAFGQILPKNLIEMCLLICPTLAMKIVKIVTEVDPLRMNGQISHKKGTDEENS